MKKLLVIGAGFLQDFVIQKSVSMGYETLTVDADPNAIGFSHAHKHAVVNIVDEKACLEYAKQEKIDGVLTAATDYGVLTSAYIAQEMGIPGLKYEVAQLIKNKYRVRKCLFEHHVDDTEQAYEVNANTDIVFLSKQLVYPVMVKPCDGSGSRGASRVDTVAQLEKACQYAMAGSITHRAEIESFITGKEYGAETLVIDGKPYLFAIMQKWMTNPPYYAELGHAIPNDLSKEIEQKAIKCVEDAICALGVNFGSVNMDMLITGKGKVHIIDIGARMGGNMIGPSIIPLGTGVDYLSCLISATVGDSVDFTAGQHGSVVSRLLAYPEGTFHGEPDFLEIEKKYRVNVFHHIKSGMHVNRYCTNLDGLGYIIASDEDVNVAQARAESAKAEIGRFIY